jgi:ATP-binding cassette subfamily B multidrug efflux pump
VFATLVRRLRATATPSAAPPAGVAAFYWHFVRQTKGLYVTLFVTGLAVALIDTVIPLVIGRLVRLMADTDRAAAVQQALPMLLGMSALVLFGRPLVLLADTAVRNIVVNPGVTSMIRWQSHWHVVRQSWPFFQNDFAGRIANRVMQTAHALRESVMSSMSIPRRERSPAGLRGSSGSN